jgi:hypothetical protein
MANDPARIMANDPARITELEEQLLLSNSLAEIQGGKQQEKQGKEVKHEEVHKAKALEEKWGPFRRASRYGWTGQQPSSGFFDRPREPLGVFASSDRF